MSAPMKPRAQGLETLEERVGVTDGVRHEVNAGLGAGALPTVK